MKELIKNKIYYKIFDKNFKNSTHNYMKSENNKYQHVEIDKNIENILSYTNVDNILFLDQVHGKNVVNADLIMDYTKAPIADGAFTSKSSLLLTIRTADCVPVLLADKKANMIGVAHCGWRGARANILENLISNMKNNGSENLLAVIGPAITQKSYEVDHEFYKNFIEESKNNEIFFINSDRTSHYCFDLLSYVKKKIKKFNIDIFDIIEEDTYSMDHKYPSYRRANHTSEIYNQSILSSILIR